MDPLPNTLPIHAQRVKRRGLFELRSPSLQGFAGMLTFLNPWTPPSMPSPPAQTCRHCNSGPPHLTSPALFLPWTLGWVRGRKTKAVGGNERVGTEGPARETRQIN